MNIIKFIFYLGIINIVFGFLWKWVVVLPAALLFTFLKFNYGMRIVKTFGVYLLVSLTAILTLAIIGENPNIFKLISYPLLGTFVLIMGFASNSYEKQKEARASMDFELMQSLEQESGFESILMVGATVFYLFALFIPILASNGLTNWLFKVIDWSSKLPVIGWLIGIGGVIFLLGIISHGLFASVFFIASIIEKFRKNTVSKPATVNDKSSNGV